MPTNNNQTSTTQPSTPSSQTQNNQSSFKDLINFTREISPLTGEILKIISILSIVFIGLGLWDFVLYTQKQGIPLSLSFLTASDLELLIILPISLLIFIFIIPYILAMIIYVFLDNLKTLKAFEFIVYYFLIILIDFTFYLSSILYM